METLNKFLPNAAWAEAMGYTLLHSLWQGLLIAGVLALLLHIFRRNSAQLRYSLGVLALVILPVWMAVTFGSQLGHTEAAPALAFNGSGFSIEHFGNSHTTVVHTGGSNFATQSSWAQWCSLLWLFGTSVLLMRLLGKLLLLNKLKYQQNAPVTAQWHNRISQLAGTLGIEKSVRALESALVKTPVTLGHLKPIILVPVGMLSSLPPEQVEALLLHELAHIKRNDFLVNLLQEVLEALCFFNPAIWWISSQVRQERENCCDDMALYHNPQNRLAYIQALSAAASWFSGRYGLAQGAAGTGKNQLLLRIQRIATVSRSYSIFKEGLFIGVLLCFSLGLIVYSATATAADTPERTLAANHVEIIKPIVPPPAPAVTLGKLSLGEELERLEDAKANLAANAKKLAALRFFNRAQLDAGDEPDLVYIDEKGDEYHFWYNSRQEVVKMLRNGEEISAEQFGNYPDAMAQAKKNRPSGLRYFEAPMPDQQQEQLRAQRERTQAQAEVHRQQLESYRGKVEAHNEAAQVKRELARLQREQAILQRKEALVQREEARKQRQIAEQHRQQLNGFAFRNFDLHNTHSSTCKDGKRFSELTLNGQLLQICTSKDGEIESFKIDGEEAEKEDYKRYKSILKEIEKEAQESIPTGTLGVKKLFITYPDGSTTTASSNKPFFAFREGVRGNVLNFNLDVVQPDNTLDRVSQKLYLFEHGHSLIDIVLESAADDIADERQKWEVEIHSNGQLKFKAAE